MACKKSPVEVKENAASSGKRQLYQSDLFNYAATLSEKEGVDTINKFILKQYNASKTYRAKSVNQLKRLSSDPTDPASYTYEQIASISSFPSSPVQIYSADLPGAVVNNTKQVEEEWEVLRNNLNLFQVNSKEVLTIDYGMPPLVAPHFSDNVHLGSYYKQNIGPIDWGTWSESLNEHYPLTFSNSSLSTITHVMGTLTVVSFTDSKENYCTFTLN